MGQDLQSSSWDSTGPNYSPRSTIRYVRCSSDGGPELSSAATADFVTKWEVRHRMSSAYFPQSNCRAEVAVKKAKRMLMDNVGPTGFLNNDGLLGALGPTPGAQHAGTRLQYITGGIWQAHSRCFCLHQPMHQVQQPIDTSHMARGMVPKGGRHAIQDVALYRSPRHAYVTTCTSIARRQSIPAKPTWFTP